MEEHRSRVAEEKVMGVSEKTGKLGAHSMNGETTNVHTSSEKMKGRSRLGRHKRRW
jgi:hypothetical protein